MRYIMLLVLVALLSSCGRGNSAGGFGSETSNGAVVASCLGVDFAASAVPVMLIPEGYNPAAAIAPIPQATCSPAGVAHFPTVEPGRYSLWASSGTHAALQYKLEVTAGDTARASLSLAPHGTALLRFPSLPSDTSFACYLPGTPLLAPASAATLQPDSSYVLALSGVPAGLLAPLHAYRDSASFAITDSLQITAGDSVEFLLTMLWQERRTSCTGEPLISITTNTVAPNGDAWFSQAGAILRLDSAGDLHCYSDEAIGLPILPIRSAGSDGDSGMLFSTSKGVLAFDGASWGFKPFFDENYQLGNILYQVMDTASDTYWFTSNSGIRRWKSDTTERIDSVVVGGDTVLLRTATTLALSPSGELWAGTDFDGVLRYDGTAWHRLSAPLPSGAIRSIRFFDGGAILISSDAGLSFFDGAQWQHFTSENSPLGACSSAILHGSRLWVVSAQNLYQYNGRSWLQMNRDNAPLTTGEVTGISIDEPRRRGYVSTTRGMLLFDY